MHDLGSGTETMVEGVGIEELDILPGEAHGDPHAPSLGDSLVRSTPCYDGVVAIEITQRQLRNDSGGIMRGLDEGETYVVTRNGVPVGELSPMRRHRFVRAEAVAEAFRNAPPVDLERFRADLDRVASQSTEPRA